MTLSWINDQLCFHSGIFQTSIKLISLAYGHTGNVLGTVSAVWSDRNARRQVVVMANAFPLGAEADADLRELLERAFCEGR